MVERASQKLLEHSREKFSASDRNSLRAPVMADDNELHVVMLPWLAFGHILPYLELSKCLAEKGHRISFVSTPRNIERLPKLPPKLSPLINLVKLSLPHVDNLPDNAEATIDVPSDKVQYLKKAYDGLEGPLSRFLESSAPDWIIYDFAPHWLPPIAAKLGVPCAFFSIFPASFLSFLGSPQAMLGGEDSRTEPEHFTVPQKWIPFPSSLAFRPQESLKIFDAVPQNASGVSDMHRAGLAIQGSDVVAVRSCTEFEPEWLRLLEEDLYQKPVFPVGLLPPSEQDRGDDKDDRWVAISQWLDKQEKGSVVYVALGSEATLSREETDELALGLELSGLPFLWVPRSDEGSLSVLPSGFENRTKGQGFICMGWAPQLRILAHPSVRVFLTHCGWSSIIEALGLGCPLVLLPLVNDQALNARLLEDKKIGLEIPRDERDGSFMRDSVAGSLKVMMVDEEGKYFKAKAREMQKIFGDKARQVQYVEDFDRYLKGHGRRMGTHQSA